MGHGCGTGHGRQQWQQQQQQQRPRAIRHNAQCLVPHAHLFDVHCTTLCCYLALGQGLVYVQPPHLQGGISCVCGKLCMCCLAGAPSGSRPPARMPSVTHARMRMLTRRCSEVAASSPGFHCMLHHQQVQLTSLQMRLSFLGLILRFCCLHRPASSRVPCLTRCFCSSSATGMSGTAISGDMDSGSLALEDAAALVCRVRNACSSHKSKRISCGAQVTENQLWVCLLQRPTSGTKPGAACCRQ